MLADGKIFNQSKLSSIIAQVTFLDQLQHNSNNFAVIMSTYLFDIAFQSLRFPFSDENTNISYDWNIFVLWNMKERNL